MPYKNLESWIEDMLGDERKCSVLTCRYELPNGGTKEIHSQALGGRTWTPDVLYRMFKGIAEQHVQDRPGLHTFEMSAYFGEKTTPDRVHTFIVADGEIKNGGSGRTITEHPTQVGLIAQLMRHHEALTTTNTQLVQTMASTWMHERRDLVEDNRTLRGEVNDAFSIIREMIAANSQREHEQRMREMEFKRTSEERAMMIKAAPGLINTLTGKEVVPNDTGDSAIVEALAEKISPEQVQQFIAMGIVPEAMGPLLVARITQIREKKIRETEQIRKLPEGDTGNVTSITKAKER